MNNKDLSPEEQNRIEADFLRCEASRLAMENTVRKKKVRTFQRDLMFEFVSASSFSAVGFLLVSAFYPRMLGMALMMLAMWVVAVTVCILKLRPIVQQTKAEQTSDGNAVKPLGVERES